MNNKSKESSICLITICDDNSEKLLLLGLGKRHEVKGKFPCPLVHVPRPYFGLIIIPFPLLVRSIRFALSNALYCRPYCATLKIVVVTIYKPTHVCMV